MTRVVLAHMRLILFGVAMGAAAIGGLLWFWDSDD